MDIFKFFTLSQPSQIETFSPANFLEICSLIPNCLAAWATVMPWLKKTSTSRRLAMTSSGEYLLTDMSYLLWA